MKKQIRVLAVDDEPNVLELVSRVLESAGYSVVSTTDSRAALALMEEHKPQLAILDIMMPGLDGLQLLGLIRERSDIPVIMLTGIGNMAAVRDTLALGADDYMKKPFSTAELLARVKAKLRRASIQ
ncbi:MAG: response regulator [Chloroflexota bacterium]